MKRSNLIAAFLLAMGFVTLLGACSHKSGCPMKITKAPSVKEQRG